MVVVYPIPDERFALIQLVIVKDYVLITLLIDTLEEVSVHPVLRAYGVGAKDKMQAQSWMTQTTKQFLVARILDLRAFLKPYDCNSVDRLELGWLIHTLENDLATIGESDCHW